jgi:hypothetical protein
VTGVKDFDYWRLCDDLSVHQAALLTVGADPATLVSVESIPYEDRPRGYEAAKSAISNALKRDSIAGELKWEREYDINGNDCGPTDNLDIHKSMVSVESLRTFLKKRDISSGFFFQSHAENRTYLNRDHVCYAPKLAAAVEAWESVSSDPSRLDGKTVKQALEKWLRENASEYGLTGVDGNPVAAAIEQISKVANWRPEGGAAKTPTSPQVQKNPTPHKNHDDFQEDSLEADSDIPF